MTLRSRALKKHTAGHKKMPREGGRRQKNINGGISLPPFEAMKPKEVRKRKLRASDFSVFNFYIFALRDLFFS